MSEQVFDSLLRIAGVIAAFGGAVLMVVCALGMATLLLAEWFGSDDSCAPKETK